MTAGFRSTELWVCALGLVLGAALAAVGLLRERDVLALGGAALTGLSVWSYCHTVGRRKAPRPYLPPVGKL